MHALHRFSNAQPMAWAKIENFYQTDYKRLPSTVLPKPV